MAFHREESGLSLHDLFAYVQSADPGAVGARVNWLDITDPAVPIWKRRNEANSGWITVATAGAGTPHAPVTVVDTASIDLTLSGQQLSAAVVDEYIQDLVGALLTDSTMVDVQYDDGGNVLSFALIYAGSGGSYGTAATAARSDHTHAGGVGATITLGLTVTLGDGTTVITSSEPPVYVKVPFACTITAWEIVAQESGSITLLVHRAPTATPTTWTEISGSSDPSLSSQDTNKDTNIAGDWSDVTLDADDWLRVTVSGTPSGVKRLGLALTLTRTI